MHDRLEGVSIWNARRARCLDNEKSSEDAGYVLLGGNAEISRLKPATSRTIAIAKIYHRLIRFFADRLSRYSCVSSAIAALLQRHVVV